MSQIDDSTSKELAGVLAALRSEGEHDSGGVFTVNLTHALPKLEKFQLPKPHFGLLKVIQSAIVSGATRIEADFGRGTISIAHNGQPPEPSELRNILDYLIAPDYPTHERSLRDLAIGVNTTLARGASWVEVGVRNDGEWIRQRWLSREESEQMAEPVPTENDISFRFTMKRTLRQTATAAFNFANTDVRALLRKGRDSMDEDSRAVFDRCRHAPTELSLNGKRLPASSFGKSVVRRWSPFTQKEHRRSNLLDILLMCDKASPHLLSPPQGSEAQLKFLVPGKFENMEWTRSGPLQLHHEVRGLERQCFGVIGIRRNARTPGVITLVKDGVDLATMAPSIVQQGVATILSAEGLPLDLSQFRVVGGMTMRKRLGAQSKILTSVLREILSETHFDDFEDEARRHLRNLAKM